MKKIFRHLKKKRIFIPLAIALLIVALVVYKKSNVAPNFDTAEAKIMNVVETVSVTGTISPVDKADLAFEKSGVLSRVYVKVGDSVKRGQTLAVLSGGNERAALASALATLADMQRSLTPEELAVEKASLESAKESFVNARKDALSVADSARVKAQGALVNYTDAFFNNPQSVNPSINIPTDSQAIATNINNERVNVTSVLSKWSTDIANGAPDSAESIVSKSRAYLATISSFMNDLAIIVNAETAASSGRTQTQIDSDKVAMNSGFSNLDLAINTIESSRSALSAAKNSADKAQTSYDLKLAGNSADSIAAEQARVAQAQAGVNQGVIISPIDGIVTKADPTAGEFVSAGSAGFAVQNNNFKIEANVPEADIAKIAVDNTASSTLDAYGSDVDFPARVVAINPAETVLEGVPTYKVTLEFTNPDARIRSGMTANLTILTHSINAALAIPYRAITDDNGQKSVKKVNPDHKTYDSVVVSTGLKGSDGYIQILSGLSAGDKVVTYIKQ